MAPRTRLQAQNAEEDVSASVPRTTTRSIDSISSTTTKATAATIKTTDTHNISSEITMYSTNSDTGDVMDSNSEGDEDMHPSGLKWKDKISATYKSLRTIEYMLHTYTKAQDEPKVEALMDMLDTIIDCLLRDGNVHKFMDDPDWIAAHSKV